MRFCRKFEIFEENLNPPLPHPCSATNGIPYDQFVNRINVILFQVLVPLPKEHNFRLLYPQSLSLYLYK